MKLNTIQAQKESQKNLEKWENEKKEIEKLIEKLKLEVKDQQILVSRAKQEKDKEVFEL